MVDVTLFEVHLDDSSFTANAPFSSSESDEETNERREPDDSGTSKGALVAAVVGLAFLVVGAALVKRRLGSDAPAEEEAPIEIDA